LHHGVAFPDEPPEEPVRGCEPDDGELSAGGFLVTARLSSSGFGLVLDAPGCWGARVPAGPDGEDGAPGEEPEPAGLGAVVSGRGGFGVGAGAPETPAPAVAGGGTSGRPRLGLGEVPTSGDRPPTGGGVDLPVTAGDPVSSRDDGLDSIMARWPELLRKRAARRPSPNVPPRNSVG
jgi:hypothetical protein